MRTLRAIEGLILLVLRVALGGLFIYAAWLKLKSPAEIQDFGFAIKGFKLLPPEGDHLLMLATYVVPWVEMIAGAALVLGLWSRAAALLLLVNLLAFIAAIWSVIARGIDTKCGCFGDLSTFCPDTITACNIIQNSVLAAVALIIAVRGPGLFALDRTPKPATRPSAVANPPDRR